MNSNWSYSPETPYLGQNRRIFFSCVTLKFEGWPSKTIGHLFYATSSEWVIKFNCLSRYFKLCASFHSHWWIQTGVTVRKRLIWVKIDDFFSRVTLKFDGWPSKTIGHLSYATSSFVYHFIAIGEFKLELQSGNAQSGSNLTLFRAVWP